MRVAKCKEHGESKVLKLASYFYSHSVTQNSKGTHSE
nr:MAG TPA: hypothetical protein [Crassvirales sp.]